MFFFPDSVDNTFYVTKDDVFFIPQEKDCIWIIFAVDDKQEEMINILFNFWRFY